MPALEKSGPAQNGDSPHRRECDVLVVGGGPAAATAARLLASWGRDVLVVAKPESPGEPVLSVSLTPSCRKFFDLMGISSAIDSAGFIPSHGNTVWWGGSKRVGPFAKGQHGWQVSASRLSRVMLGTVEAAGGRVQRATLTADDVLAWPARMRIDASGRAGVLARPLGRRRHEPGHRTVALIGHWRRTGDWPLADPSHTLLESYADGWGWSVPVAADTRALAVMVDPKTTNLTKGEGAKALYLAEVAKMCHLSELFRGSDLTGSPSGWDASMYVAEQMSGDGWLLAGDAGCFVDPLSSAGVKKAMASGWLAAVAISTALAEPALATTAFDFYAARERATYAQFLTLTRQFLFDGAPAPDHPFWADRAAPAPAGDGDAVMAAWDKLRSADTLALRVAPDVTFARRPALTERAIVLEERLVTPLVPDGVRFVDSVDVVSLARLAPGATDVPDLFEKYVRQAGATDFAAFARALATAVARSWLLGA
jgi:flavin-dependent dehydrogenase